jgi:hypothetical protein
MSSMLTLCSRLQSMSMRCRRNLNPWEALSSACHGAPARLLPVSTPQLCADVVLAL